jgi:hypothetical protein
MKWKVFAVFLHQMDDDLGVGVGEEPMPSLFETGPEFSEVIDLTVEEKPETLALIRDGLVGLGAQVDDA